MGGVSSTTTNPISSHGPTSSTSSSDSTISSSDIKPSESKTHKDQTSNEARDSSISNETRKDSDMLKEPSEENGDDGDEVEDEEEEGECPFCLFMKGGGCKDTFIAWEDCVQEAENNNEDVVEKCHEVTGALTKCMQAHADYYEPILRAEESAKEKLREEMEQEKAIKESDSNVTERETEIAVDSRD